jgi:hypothetical protein
MTENTAHRALTSGRRRCAGQAMTEFVITATLFLIPVFLIIPLLGKYADMKSAVVQAARYNAWERTVWYANTASSSGTWPGNDKTDAAIRTEMTSRFFVNDLWYDRGGAGMVGATANTISNGDPPGTLTSVFNFIFQALSYITSPLGTFELELKGLYAGTATLTTANINPIGVVTGGTAGMEDWGSLNLGIADTNVILANGWGANGTDHVKEQTEALTITSLLSNPVIDALRWVLAAAGFWELAPTVLEFGKIVPDEVPPDRLE